MKKILLTGGLGFIGRNIAKYLSNKGHIVIGCGRGQLNALQKTEIGYSAWYSGSLSYDLLKETNFEPDVVIHCAGGGSVEQSLASPRADYLDTVQSTELVLEFVRTMHPLAKFIFPSSPAVIGHSQTQPMSVSLPPNPLSPYGHDRLIAENICETYRHNYGLNIFIVRLFSVYGEGLQKQLFWDACSKFTNDVIPEFWGNGDETRDFIQIRDVAELLNLVINSNSKFLPYKMNCGSGKAIKIRDVLSLLKEYLKNDKEIIFNNFVREGDPRDYLSNNSESLEYGWSPSITIESGLKDYVDWFKSLK